MEIFQTIFLVLVGLVIGSFLPFAFLYLVVYLRHHTFGWKTLFGALIRVLLIPVLFAVIMGISSLLLQPLGIGENAISNESSKSFYMYFGLAIGTGFFAGIAVFIGGIISAIRQRKRRADNSTIASP